MVGCRKRTPLYQAQEWGKRAREGLLADSDIEDINRDRPGRFAGKSVICGLMGRDPFWRGVVAFVYLAKKARISS